MSARERVFWLALLGGLVTGCHAEPVGVGTDAEDRLLQPRRVGNPVGPVTLRTSIDFSAPPFRGTFEVTEGRERLDCDGGEFVNGPARSGGAYMMSTEFTCTRGPGAGSFTATFQPKSRLGLGGLRGRWNVVDGTGRFSGLRGTGDFSLRFTGPMKGSGKIRFEL